MKNPNEKEVVPQKKHYKDMTAQELRAELNIINQNCMMHGKDGEIVMKFLNLGTPKLKEHLQKARETRMTPHHYFGAMKGNAIYIPEGWSPIPYYIHIIDMRIELMKKEEYGLSQNYNGM